MTSFTDKFQHILDTAVENLPAALTTVVVGLIAIEVGLFVINKIFKWTGVRAGLRKVLRSLLRAFMWIVLFLATIEALGLHNIIVAITGSSVILALFLSTGVAPLISDIIAGLFLGSDREFQPGAKVKAGSEGTEGEIVNMDIRKVYLKDGKGTIHVLPNSVVEKSEWVIVKSVNDWSSKHRRGRVKKSA